MSRNRNKDKKNKPKKRKAPTAHHAPTAGDLNFGYWAVAFIDLLGQKDAFLRTDSLPTDNDPTKRQGFVAAVQASLGVVRNMRVVLDRIRSPMKISTIAPDSPLRRQPPEVIARLERLKRHRVREHRWSDGVLLACPLMPERDHAVPVFGVYDILFTCAGLMLIQLASGNPIRGGVDVGTGVEADGELFGAALVKAYQLESEVAKFPRLAVGDALVAYLQSCTGAPGDNLERQFERAMAARLLGLIVRDTDGRWTVDYAGPLAREVLTGNEAMGFFTAARAFAMGARDGFRIDGRAVLFERYSALVQYLDRSAPLWGEGE